MTAALDALANALDAHVSGKEQVVAVVEGEREPTVLVPSVVPEVTDEHRRFAERRLRKAGVLR